MTEQQQRKSEESKILSMRVTQDISEAMLPVTKLASTSPSDNNYDHDHATLASGICALGDADKITRARITDVRNMVAELCNSIKPQRSIIQRGLLKGLPITGVMYCGCFIAVLIMATVMFAMARGQLQDLAEAWKIVKFQIPYSERMVSK